jgi:hypothetical protein
VTRAKCIVFLGLAYHSLNLALQRVVQRQESVRRRVFGTAYGMSEPDVDVVSGKLADLRNSNYSQSVGRS